MQPLVERGCGFGCPSGNRRSLLADRVEEREGAEAGANIRHYQARVAELARMAAGSPFPIKRLPRDVQYTYPIFVYMLGTPKADTGAS